MGAKSAARSIVEYLVGLEQQPAGRHGEPDPALSEGSGLGDYYADAARRAGRWHGQGAERFIPSGAMGHVDPLMLERLLLGCDPVSGEPRIGTQGSNGRAAHELTAPATGDVLSAVEAAALVGVDASYIRRVAARTAKADGDLPPTHLVGRKSAAGWEFDRAEVERFARERVGQSTVLGFDLTFSVPKSVSVAWAAADEVGREVIENALHDAVGEALRYVESEAVRTWRRRDTEPASDFIAASFLHDTNRELEPQLHVHVAVMNMATTPAGKVQALDGRPIYGHASTAGHLAEVQFQRALIDRGYAFTPTTKGIGHVVGVPQATVTAMSTRRAQIMAEVDAVGADSPAARQLAAWATRAAKVSGVDQAALEERWQERFAATGFDREKQRALTDNQPPLLWTPDDDARLIRHLSSPTGVTANAALFDRRATINAIVDHAYGRLSASEVLTRADRWLHSEAVIPLEQGTEFAGELIGRHRSTSLTPGETWYTTPEIVRIETAILDGYEAGHTAGVGQVDAETLVESVERWEARSGHRLGADQRDAVAAICMSGDRFQAMVGPAGSGKTAALEVAARAWEAAGFTPVGAAVNGNAAEVLERSTGIPSRTVASLVTSLDAGNPEFDLTTILIVDEASTLGDRDHAALLRHVEAAGAVMRTVGDPAQHSAVTAGGTWAYLTERHADRTPRLSENRRMTGDGMEPVRLAVADYRNGRIADALDRLQDDDRIVTAGTSGELLDQLAADWFVDWSRHLDDPESVAASRMLAETHRARRELNERAQLLLREANLIGGDGVRIGESTFHTGDRVIARTQNRELRSAADPDRWVRNGTRGTVIDIRSDDDGVPSLLVDFDHRGPITVPHDWLVTEVRPGVRGGLTPAYAMTTHAAQGDTFEASRSLVTDRSSRPGQYVALTRGRNDVRLYAVDAAELRDPLPIAEHRIPTVDDARPLPDRIEASLTRPEAAEVAIVADPGLAGVGAEWGDRAERNAQRQLDHLALTDPPPHLVAMLGTRPDEHGEHRNAWDTAVTAHAHYTRRWTEPADRLPLPPSPSTSHEQRDAHVDLTAHLIAARAMRFPPLSADLQNDLTARYRNSAPPTDVERGTTERLERQAATASATRSTATVEHAAASTNKVRRRDPDAQERTRRALETAVGTEAVVSAKLEDHRLLTTRGVTDPGAMFRQRIEIGALDQLTPTRPTIAPEPRSRTLPGLTRTRD